MNDLQPGERFFLRSELIVSRIRIREFGLTARRCEAAGAQQRRTRGNVVSRAIDVPMKSTDK
jgi:hypothetical protein